MARKPALDFQGMGLLFGFSLLMGVNQVAIKLTNGGLQPVLAAGLRSGGALVCLMLWMWIRGRPARFTGPDWRAGVVIGLVFGVEFLMVFISLDLTTVGRTSLMLYTMPVWLAVAAHFLLPGERLTPRKSLGLVLALAGIAWVLLTGDSGAGSLLGDLLALGAAVLWMTIALMVRLTRLADVHPQMQLLWQISVSAVLLLAVAPFFGPLLRDPAPIHFLSLGFQIVVVIALGFSVWFWLMSVYPAAAVASFGFLSPIFGVLAGWLLLGEEVGASIVGALVLVVAGLVLINRPKRRV